MHLTDLSNFALFIGFQNQLQSYESEYTRNLQSEIISARESSPTDLINLLNKHADGPFNDIKVRDVFLPCDT